MNAKPDRPLGNWLLLLAFMVFGMAAGGGHVRTIGASFIIQSWHPVTGFIPPLNTAAWAREFALYQKTALYQSHPISLATFQSLYWPMFLDRCWGRLMALVFLIPFGWFLWRRRIGPKLAVWLFAIFAAGGAQAVFGWYLVRTGLYPAALMPPAGWAAPHFISAVLIFAALLWTGLSLRSPTPMLLPGLGRLRGWASASLALLLLTMCFGALVTATNAITVFNSFPLMDGHVVPPGALALHPLWANFLFNKATVQFCHRGLATITALTVLITAVLGLRAPLGPALRDNFLILAGLVALQYMLGMATIVLGAAELGYVHELNALLLLAAALAARHGLRGATSARTLSIQMLPAGAE